MANMCSSFSLCDSIETQNDVDNFFQTVAGNFEGVVQYNKDNRAFEVKQPIDSCFTRAKTIYSALRVLVLPISPSMFSVEPC